MTSTPTSPVPPGWYPDPEGLRQWRVWNGETWTQLTRPFGDTSPSSVGASLDLIRALHRLVRYGNVAAFAGLGLVVSMLAHWPGTPQPLPAWFAATALDAGLSLLVIGSACFSFGVRELEGRWTVLALIPGLNVLNFSALVVRRLGGRSPLRRVAAETLLLILFITQARVQPWLGVAPMMVAWGHTRWDQALLSEITGTPTSRTTPSS